ncbi:MAG: hypothetical protein ABIS50_09750 [Luteolibacter sp.]|uniref:hypothetical protein n=1 Tax=Luteolibacter sp. TaxID=1962973 RepID=UPI003267DF3F
MSCFSIQTAIRRTGVAFVCLAASAVHAQTLAFPNAEGFGRFASGGRGGEVYVVTNLNNSGAGSLREGVTNRAAGVPRTIVFAVSGTIYLNSTLRITQGNLTIAGQSAPGDGICLAWYPIDPSNSSNVIIRFIRSRLGDTSGNENDAFSCRYASNVIVDHCSFSWSVDETASSYDNTNFTMQWCMVTESLRDSVHSKGPHGYGAIWGGLGATFHHNLIAHHDSRNPRFNGSQTHGTDGEIVDMRNNVIYNWRSNSTYGGQPADDGTPAHQNMINNYYKSGPATPSTNAVRYRILEPTANPLSTGGQYSLFHISGNLTSASATVSSDNWNGGVQVISASLYPTIRAAAPVLTSIPVTQTALDAYPLVLAHGGCRLPVRDSVDTRVISEVQGGNFTYRGSKGNYPGIIDSQADVGGWPTLASTPAPADGDSDGMPDSWETAHSLNPAAAADRNTVDAAGYTNLELYLNELAASAFPIPQIGTQPQSQTVTAGAGFGLTVVASGTAPLAYQWYLGNSAIAGATAANYSVGASTAAHTGEYTVVVTNGYGSVRSAVASIVIDSQPPVITSGPVSLAVETGQAVAFSVTASGTLPIFYQWYRGERPVAGATDPILALGAATPAAAGPYHVVVSSPHGSATSATGTLTVTSVGKTDVFSSTFGTDTIHAASPIVSPTSTNWYVMSSKDARTSNIAGSRLDLTMPTTTSGIVDTAALFSAAPLILADVGEMLRLRVLLSTTNVRTLGLGLYHSGGSPPYTGLINSQLIGGSSALATGGTQGWSGYRFHLDAGAAGPAIALERRSTQPGTTNASQSVIAPGTSSSAPTVQSVGSGAVPGFSWADNATYALVFTLKRGVSDAFEITATLHAGSDPSAPAIGTATATTTGAAVAGGLDAMAIGYRNRDSSSVSHVRVSQVTVERIENVTTVSNSYEAFLLTHGLDPATTGFPTADPDRDGVANALEFILGGNPNIPNTSILPTLSFAAGWHFRFLRHDDTTSTFIPAVESSTDLVTWNSLVDGVDGVMVIATPFDATHEQIDVHLPDAPESHRFLRLSAKPKPTP